MPVSTIENRWIKSEIESRLDEVDPYIQVILGPRQVGRTTALLSALRDRGVYFSADSPVPQNNDIIGDLWQRAESCKSKILAIDEVQKINNWDEAIKFYWDKSIHKNKIKLVFDRFLVIVS